MPTKGKRIWSVITSLLLVVVIVLALLLVGARVVGLTPYVVLSGSMEPTYPTGSLLYVKKVSPEEVQVGDPITFVMNEDLLVATHRVVAIDAENQRFTTKGDANEAVDGAPVHFNNLLGKPVFCIPKLGYLSNFLTDAPGKYVAWSAIGVLVVLLFAPELLRWAEKSDQKAAERKNQTKTGPNDPKDTP